MIENFELAHKLNKQFETQLIERKLHFRASIGSLSLIELSSERPELGIKCSVKKYSSNDVESVFEKDLLKLCEKAPNQRLTPEKVLQSWIIQEALKNKGRLPFDSNIEFITSELAIYCEQLQKKVVVDIIGYCHNSNRICIIELKYDRHLKRLIEQVNHFQLAIDENQELSRNILQVHGHSNVDLNARKVIVWPFSHSEQVSQTLVNNNITEYGYMQDSRGFTFVSPSKPN